MGGEGDINIRFSLPLPSLPTPPPLQTEKMTNVNDFKNSCTTFIILPFYFIKPSPFYHNKTLVIRKSDN